MKYIIAATACLSLLGTANAQSWRDGWTGEGSLSAGVTTGNTDTADIGVGLKLAKTFGPWKVATQGSYDYGRQNGETNRDRWFVSAQGDRAFTDRIFGFVRTTYEEDDFSGFDSRLFVGVGAGYHIFKEEKLRWSVEVAPGYRRSQIADIVDEGPPVIVLTPGGTANDVAIRGASKFAYDFNENVNFTNDTNLVWTETSTQTINIAALNAKLTKAITARVSFEVRNDTNPPDGFVNTDTATKASIVYGF